jgi:hypothetical protein
MNVRQEPLTAPEALMQYMHLVSILEDEDWRVDTEALEAHVGRPIAARAERQTAYGAARAALDAALVEAVAAASRAGIPIRQLKDHRGWLSHNDVAELVARAKKPSAGDVVATWPQRIALRAVVADVQALLNSDTASAMRLARSARTFLRSWAEQVPSAPPPELTQQVAAQHRPDFLEVWVNARKQLFDEIDALLASGRQS